LTSTFQTHDTGVLVICFVVIVLGKSVYFFSLLPLSKSRLAVKPNANGAPFPNAGGASVDADVRGIVIVSTWRRCSASRAVDESSLAVTDYLLGQCDNLLQFARQKDGATRCAQIVQLLLANHVDHYVSDPLVTVQLDVSNAFCSVARQPQFDVLASKASRSYDDGRVQVGDELPRPRTLDRYWSYFLSMQGNASTYALP